MANAKTGYGVGGTSSDYHFHGVSVDTDPGTDGYWSEEVSITKKAGQNGNCLWFTIEEITGATVHLQYKKKGSSTWRDYDSDGYTTTQYLKLEVDPDDLWRCGVKDDNQGTSSESRISW